MSAERNIETQKHEFEVIDAIVRGGGEVRPEDAALTDFALLVRNARAVPNHGEAAALDARAETVDSKRKRRQSVIFKPVFAGACVIVLMVVVSGVALFGSTDRSTVTDASKEVPFAFPEVTKTEPDFAQAVPSTEGTNSKAAQLPGITSSQLPREVARDTRITLAADGSEIERISGRVYAIVDRFGGYVASSKVRGGEADRGRATFDLMIPAAQYKPALAAVSKLAHVRARSQASEDITTEVNSAERELKRLTDRVNQLENKLAVAETTAQKVMLRRQLLRASAARRVAARPVRANRSRVNYVPIALTIIADRSAADKDKGEIAKAFDKAGEILTSIAAALIVALAALLPLALICAALWLGVTHWRRSKKARTIDSAAVIQSE